MENSSRDDGGSPYPGDAAVTDPFELPGVPDSFARLWTPHRLAYIKGGQEQVSSEHNCPFCAAPSRSDEESLIVHRGKYAFVILNLFPYNAGHLLVCPYRHVPDYTDIDGQETAEIASLTQTAMRVLRKVSNPSGFNLGMNQGVTGERESQPICTSTSCRAGAGTVTSCQSLPRPRPSPRPWEMSGSRWPMPGRRLTQRQARTERC